MIPGSTSPGHRPFVPHSGGAVFNTSIALGRLGKSVGLLTGLSTDMFGMQLRSELEASNVDTTHVIVSDRPTTLAFVNLVDGQATYNFFDENSAGKMLAPSDMPNLPKGISALFFGGISLACEPCADAYATLLESAAEERVVMLDPNIRANFIENPIQYRDRLDRMMALSDIVKISDEDLNWIFPDAETLTIKVRKLLNLGPKIVVLTRGSEGATAFTASGSEIFVPASIVDVVDTVGAGDTFNAGFLASLVDSDVLYKPAIAGTGDATISHALEFAVRVAAVAVSRAGADPPWVNEL